MIVKCKQFGHIQSDMSVNVLIGLTRQFGKESLQELLQTDSIADPNNISISRDEALVLVGGRQSIIQLLQQTGDNLLIKGGAPMMVGFARKHHLFGKNETCVKILSHRRKLPNDGVNYEDLGKYVQSAVCTSAVAVAGGFTFAGQVWVKPSELAGALQRMFN